jgi:MFS family permease
LSSPIAIPEVPARSAQTSDTAEARRSLLGACVAHVLHDGYTDLIHPLLPVWQAQFGLAYTGLAILRTLYFGTLGVMQVPGDRFIRRRSLRAALAGATFVAATGYFVMALPMGLAGLCAGLVLAGLGSSVQHPRASVLVTQAYGAAARGPLGIYNFSGDVGKALLTALVAILVPIMAWRPALGIISLLGFITGFSLLALIPRRPFIAAVESKPSEHGATRRGFGLLFSIGVLDTATRMGYLLFLPFLIQGRGGSSATVGLGVALVFVGGAFGKAACGWLGQHLGVVGSVIVTELATAALIAVTLFTPLTPLLIALPLLGVMLNGTSSVLYGTVPELAPRGDAAHAFAVFYTGVIISGASTPIFYGIAADHFGRTVGVIAAALTAVVTIPLALALRSALTGPSKQLT